MKKLYCKGTNDHCMRKSFSFLIYFQNCHLSSIPRFLIVEARKLYDFSFTITFRVALLKKEKLWSKNFCYHRWISSSPNTMPYTWKVFFLLLPYTFKDISCFFVFEGPGDEKGKSIMKGHKIHFFLLFLRKIEDKIFYLTFPPIEDFDDKSPLSHTIFLNLPFCHHQQ